jgi:signal transduction histidine kinase
VLTALVAVAVRSGERAAEQARLDAAADTVAIVLSEELAEVGAAVADAGVTLRLLPDLDAASYGSLMRELGLPARFPGVVAVDYVELVDDSDDPRRVIAYSHPDSDEGVVGQDLDEQPASGEAAATAGRTGRPTLSAATRFRRLPEGEPGAVIHAPVPAVGDRPEATLAIVFSVQGLVDGAELLPDGMALQLRNAGSDAFTVLATVGPYDPDAPSTTAVVDAVDRRWEVDVVAVPGATTPWWRRASTAVVAAGLLAAVLVYFLIRALVTRERLASALVAERTAELSAVNERLALSNAALADAGRTKDEFLAAVSHELRTPLTVISGFSDSLRRMHGDDAELARFLDPIDRNVRRLDTLVGDLLTLVSLDAGAVTPFRERIDLAHVLPEAPTVLAGLEGPVDVVVEPGAVVTADPRHLDRVLTNLLVNAQRHGAAPFELHAAPDGDVVQLCVRDHGSGIPDDSRELLFERFARGEHSRSVAGTGLGLAIVRELIELNGGDVRYEDAGPGARFVLRLPRHDGVA